MTHSEEHQRASEASRDGRRLGVWLGIVAFGMLAIAQGALLVASGSVRQRAIGLLVAAASIGFAWWPRAESRRLTAMGVAGSVGFANVVVHLLGSDAASSAGLLQSTVIYGYVSLWLALAGSALFRRAAAGPLVSAFTITVALVAAEAVLPQLRSRPPSAADVMRWVGGSVPHPVLEEAYEPNSEATTVYFTNPRGYFHANDARRDRWELMSHGRGSVARLVLPDAPDADGVRVEISRLGEPTPGLIQLTFAGVSLDSGADYAVTFRARADRPRRITYGVSMNHAPWQGLGLYRDIEIGTTWRDEVQTFRPTAADDRARLHFDLGADASAVDIEGLEIRRVDTRASAVRALPVEYAVNYRFNDHGCRGPDYPIPAPPNRRRILGLGDSHMLGVGVHQEDTFTVQLQAILNADPAATRKGLAYDVINCGVSGYSTRQERLQFEILGPEYRPDIVILGMVLNDDSSWRSDLEGGYVHLPNQLDRISPTWNLLQRARHEGRKPEANFAGSLEDVRRLRELCRRINARLVVFEFRNAVAQDAWLPLEQTMAAGLAGTDVPWLDVGDRLLADHPWQELVVHLGGDYHPNEIAHRSAAEQIAELLRTNGLLD